MKLIITPRKDFLTGLISLLQIQCLASESVWIRLILDCRIRFNEILPYNNKPKIKLQKLDNCFTVNKL